MQVRCFFLTVLIILMCYGLVAESAPKGPKRLRLISKPNQKSQKSSKRFKTIPLNKNINPTFDGYSILKSGAEKVADFVKFEAGVIQNVMKGAVDLVSVKHVTYYQILGKWKIYQDVDINEDAIFSYPVSIELLEDGTIRSKYNDEEHTSTFKFTERQWPKKCSIEFEIKSYKSDDDAEPVPLLYKGYFKRSILNSHIVFMKGKLYQTTGKAFWRQTKRVGKFKATKRRYVV